MSHVGTNAKCRLHRGMSEFEVQSGKHVLVLSSSQFDPTQTCAGGDRKVLFAALAADGPVPTPADPTPRGHFDRPPLTSAKTGVHLSSYLTAPPVMPLMKRSKKRL